MGERSVAAVVLCAVIGSVLQRIDAAIVSPNVSCPHIVTRADWAAAPAKQRDAITSLPVPFVILHHTYRPEACNSSENCEAAMRTMQHMHQDGRGWFDIGYNFCVGGTGDVYEGRGWDVQGAHAPRYNNRSTGICIIGDYMQVLPTSEMMEAAKSLIQCGVDRGSIAADYKLLGHRQVRDTLCPGDTLYNNITTWPHWDSLQDVVPVPQQ